MLFRSAIRGMRDGGETGPTLADWFQLGELRRFSVAGISDSGRDELAPLVGEGTVWPLEMRSGCVIWTRRDGHCQYSLRAQPRTGTAAPSGASGAWTYRFFCGHLWIIHESCPAGKHTREPRWMRQRQAGQRGLGGMEDVVVWLALCKASGGATPRWR